MVSSSPPACREFLYEMSGSQQSSRCRAIWNVMKRSRYMWLGRNGRRVRTWTKRTRSRGAELDARKQVCIPSGGLLSTPLGRRKHQLRQLSRTPVMLGNWSPRQESAWGGNLHSPLVLSHQLGGELAEDVQERQVERRASLSLGTRILKRKLNTVPANFTDRGGRIRCDWAYLIKNASYIIKRPLWGI